MRQLRLFIIQAFIVGLMLAAAGTSVHALEAEPVYQEAEYIPALNSGAPIDTEISSWAVEDVDWMIVNEIVPKQLRFNYKHNITREEFSVLTVSVLEFMSKGKVNLIHTMPENKFNDTDSPEVYRAYSFGIVNGVSETEFKPDNLISRQEAAVMMANLLKSIQAKHLSTEDANYPDKLSIAAWALDSVNITSNNKIFQGSANGFRPQDHYTREQAIAVMRRLLNVEGSASIVSLRGHVAIHLNDLGTEEDAASRQAPPIAALVGTRSVTFTWTEATQTPNAYVDRFQDEHDHGHEYGIQFADSTIDSLKLGSTIVREGIYTIQLGTGSQREGFLLGIFW